MPKLPAVRQHTDEELRKLALDVLSGNVMFSFQVPPQDIGIHFMPIMFMDEEMRKSFDKLNVGAVYEYMSKALSMGVNGLPIFPSLNIVTVDELNKLKTYIKEAEEIQKQFVEGSK